MRQTFPKIPESKTYTDIGKSIFSTEHQRIYSIKSAIRVVVMKCYEYDYDRIRRYDRTYVRTYIRSYDRKYGRTRISLRHTDSGIRNRGSLHATEKLLSEAHLRYMRGIYG